MRECAPLTSAQGYDGTRRARAFRILTNVIQALQHPTDRTIATAHQNLVVLNVSENVQPAKKHDVIVKR